MRAENMSSGGGFLIVGFSDFPQLQVPLFLAFLLIYLLTMVGNLVIIATIFSSSRLRTPMYFFLTHLSFLEMSAITVIFPQMLAHFFLEENHISLTECILHLYIFLIMTIAEIVLLTVMAYDRYMAICNPFRYLTIMNKTVCNWLAAVSWASGLLIPLPHITMVSGLDFCESHTINHFFCDITALMKLSCSSTYTIELLSYILGTIITVMCFLSIIISYIFITVSILNIKSKGGRQKAFSTCGSHLTVVILFYSSLCSAYMRPTSAYTMKESKLLSLSYTAVTPMCNPIIYTLKNTEFKNALRNRKTRT
ncbi:olfactory receptor 8D2-like [Lissotriton helveticus]